MLYMLSFIRKYYLLSCHHHCIDASPKYTRQQWHHFSHPDTETVNVLQVLTCNLG